MTIKSGTHIALIHTDLRVYWPPRLLALGRAVRRQQGTLSVIEIAGRGSPYDYAGRTGPRDELDWHILFPDGDLRSLSPRQMAQAVEQKLDDLQPDVIMAGAIAFPSGAAAVRWARRHRCGVIIFDNARRADVPRSWIVESVKKRLYAHVDAVLIPAESHVPSYVGWGIPRSHLHLGLNVVDNEWFSSRADALRNSVGGSLLGPGFPSRFFLGVGRQIGEKNWATCLEAYRRYRLPSENSRWGLVLVGDGPDRALLQERVRGESIPDVRFAGQVYGEDLVAYYAAARALVLPSVRETWGLVVNEAMACGLPVLVSDRCGCAETLVQDGVNGWRFAPDQPHELAERMRQMSHLSDRQYQQMAAASREIVRPWGLERFVAGAQAAIAGCQTVNRGFASWADRLLISLWNGRFRPI